MKEEHIKQLFKELNSVLGKLDNTESINIQICTNGKETYTIPLTKDTKITGIQLKKTEVKDIELLDPIF